MTHSKRDATAVMVRDELGPIDFRWQVGERGLRRVVEDHKLARRVPVILARGVIQKGRTRVRIEYLSHRVILADNVFGISTNYWVLTGYRVKKKGNR